MLRTSTARLVASSPLPLSSASASASSGSSPSLLPAKTLMRAKRPIPVAPPASTTLLSAATASKHAPHRTSAPSPPFPLPSPTTRPHRPLLHPQPIPARLFRPSLLSRPSPSLLLLRHLSTARPTETPPRPTDPNRTEADDDAADALRDEEEARQASKRGFKARLRYLTRRYGWWALGVYLAVSFVDFSLTLAAIHLLGADHIRALESRIRHAIGLAERHRHPDDGNGDDGADGAATPVSEGDKAKTGKSPIWTEAVLAYTIHKTLLLPVRVALTAAVTPSFVKWLVRMGWARSHAAVRRAAEQAAKGKAAAAVRGAK